MGTIKKYDIPGIDKVMNRYEDSPVNSGNGAGIFFRWQLLVGGSPFDSSKISNYMAPTDGGFKVDSDGRHTLDFNLKNLLGINKYNPGSYDLRLYTHVTPHNETSTRDLEFYVKTISPKKNEIVLGVHDPLPLEGNTSEAATQNSS